MSIDNYITFEREITEHEKMYDNITFTITLTTQGKRVDLDDPNLEKTVSKKVKKTLKNILRQKLKELL